jgi:hypothetical protein
MINIEEIRAILIGVKVCFRCGEIKILYDFQKSKGRKDGRQGVCKKCKNESTSKWRLDNPEKVKEYGHMKYYENPKKSIDAARKWQIENPERAKETNRLYRIKNKEKVKANSIRWKKDNPDKVKIHSKRDVDKRRSTPRGKLNHNVSTAVRLALKSNKAGRHWEDLVGYTVEELKKHLEKKFKKGMSWSNYGKHGWNIDHKIPLTVFHFEKPEDIDFKRAWALSNLQPMWASDNFKKNKKLSKPFQPALKIIVTRKAA